jgi:hypothetical protein
MRVTFPQWSPCEDKLSLWVTFMPAYRSLLSRLLGGGLRPGDPAAVFDLKTGQLGWLPVNAQEKVQIGHYYLLKRNYAQAWRWYEEAERELPRPEPVVVSAFWDAVRALQEPRDFSFFQYHCLTKLGRVEEARARLDQFRRLFLPRFEEPPDGRAPQASVTVDGKTLERHLQDLLAPGSLISSLLEDLYAAEVFLSLDAAPEGEVFFRTALGQADTDAARLSRALVLSQILLLERKDREYADLASQTIAPLLTPMLKPVPAGESRDFLDPTTLTEFVGAGALLPLSASEFLSRLPDRQLQDMLPRWEKLHAKATDGSRPLLDFVLHGLYQTLGREKERQDVAARLKDLPAGNVILSFLSARSASREGVLGK